MNLLDSLNNWIYTIITAMIFATLVEILMPNSQMKKYTKMVLGLLVMTIILNPVVTFLNKDFSITSGSFKFQNQLDSIYLKKQSTVYTEKQSEYIEKLYRQNLENQIEQQLKKEFIGKNIKVKVDTINDKSSDKYYDITKITVFINNGIKPVDKVKKISVSNDKQDDTKKLPEEYGSIRNKISALYNISKDKIQICVDE